MICCAVNVHLADRRDTAYNSSEQRQIAVSCDVKAMLPCKLLNDEEAT